MSGFTGAGVVCAHGNPGYQGTVTYTVCSGNNQPYSVSGCFQAPVVTGSFNFVVASGAATQAQVEASSKTTLALQYSVSESRITLSATQSGGRRLEQPASENARGLQGTSGNWAVTYTITVTHATYQAAVNTAQALTTNTATFASQLSTNLQSNGVSPTALASLTVSNHNGAVSGVCDIPTTTGYNLAGVTGTLAISGFSPSGGTCATGYTGVVTYTVCPSHSTAFSVAGCTQDPVTSAAYKPVYMISFFVVALAAASWLQ
jgi:hypothetical protein